MTTNKPEAAESQAQKNREAVARAICTACDENPDFRGDARGNEYRWQDYLEIAEAAMAAGIQCAPLKEKARSAILGLSAYIPAEDGRVSVQKEALDTAISALEELSSDLWLPVAPGQTTSQAKAKEV